jgi:hypothetical protein
MTLTVCAPQGRQDLSEVKIEGKHQALLACSLLKDLPVGHMDRKDKKDEKPVSLEFHCPRSPWECPDAPRLLIY